MCKNLTITVTKEHNGIPEGSVVYVKKELKNSYKGIWPFMGGSYIVSVKKKYCKINSAIFEAYSKHYEEQK